MSRNSNKMHEARLYVINKYCPIEDLSKQDMRNRALSKVYRDRGDEFLEINDFSNARQAYLNSIKHNPLAFWSWINFIKALLQLSSRN